MDRDRRGRRRQPGQDRGLRPIHPLLPASWISRALRVAMSAEDWNRFDRLVAEATFRVSTQARAHGEVITGLMEDRSDPRPGLSNWMDWESQKALRLLRPSH